MSRILRGSIHIKLNPTVRGGCDCFWGPETNTSQTVCFGIISFQSQATKMNRVRDTSFVLHSENNQTPVFHISCSPGSHSKTIAIKLSTHHPPTMSNPIEQFDQLLNNASFLFVVCTSPLPPPFPSSHPSSDPQLTPPGRLPRPLVSLLPLLSQKPPIAQRPNRGRPRQRRHRDRRARRAPSRHARQDGIRRQRHCRYG